MKKMVKITLVSLIIGFIVLNCHDGFGSVGGTITVVHTNNENWIINYNLDKKVVGIMLGPETKTYHESSWNLPEDFELVSEKDGYTWLKRKDSKGFRKLSFNIKTYSEMVLYAPQPFTVFDKGVSINTGPLGFSCKVNLFGISEKIYEFLPLFTFKGAKDEKIIIPGESKTENVSIPDLGSFVFFGSKDAVEETENLQLIIDDDFPQSIQKHIAPTVKRVMSYYDKNLRHAIEKKLMIQMTYETDTTVQYLIGGNAQNNQFSGKARGTVAEEDVEELVLMNKAFLAHEMAHIWQVKLGEDNMRWYAEGGADLLSYRAMIDMDIMKEDYLINRINECFTESKTELEKTSLEAPQIQGYPQLNYTAGMLTLIAAEFATAADGTRDDIFKIDRELGKTSIDSLNNFPQEAFNKTLISLGATQESVSAIEYFIHNKHENPHKAYMNLFNKTGVKYEVNEDRLLIRE